MAGPTGGQWLRQVLEAVLSGLSSPRPREDPVLSQNIDRSIEYRREYYKYAIGIASALLAFTVSFPPTLKGRPDHPEYIVYAWGGLGVAVMAGVAVHLLWSYFFITWRDFDHRGDSGRGRQVRGVITLLRRVLDLALIAALLVGVAGVVAFAAANVNNIAAKGDEAHVQSAGAGP